MARIDGTEPNSAGAKAASVPEAAEKVVDGPVILGVFYSSSSPF